MNIFVMIVLTLSAVGALYVGLKKVREAALVGRIRETPVRDISSGMVRVFGRIEGDDPLISPLTGVPCYYYHASARALSKKREWRDRKKTTAQRDFYLNDGTGRVRVVSKEAEFIGLTTTLKGEVGIESKPSCKVDPSLNLTQPSEERLRGLLIADWQQTPVAGVGIPSPSLTEMREEEKEEKRKWWVPGSIEIEGLGELEVKEEALAYYLSEEALVAGKEYSIVGTCEQDPDTGAGENARMMIRKGMTQKTFVVSAKRGSQLVSKLRLQGLALVGVSVALFFFAGITAFSRGHWEGHESPAGETAHAD